MEVSPSELMNILNRIIAKRKTCLFVSYLKRISHIIPAYGSSLLCFLLFIWNTIVFENVCECLPILRSHAIDRWVFSCISDSDLRTDGFSIESCRSMVAVMDVSFLSLGDSVNDSTVGPEKTSTSVVGCQRNALSTDHTHTHHNLQSLPTYRKYVLFVRVLVWLIFL